MVGRCRARHTFAWVASFQAKFVAYWVKMNQSTLLRIDMDRWLMNDNGEMNVLSLEHRVLGFFKFFLSCFVSQMPIRWCAFFCATLSLSWLTTRLLLSILAKSSFKWDKWWPHTKLDLLAPCKLCTYAIVVCLGPTWKHFNWPNSTRTRTFDSKLGFLTNAPIFHFWRGSQSCWLHTQKL